MKLDYMLLDVFTRHPLHGNPLAVVLHADGVSETRMQGIAAEFNLSETVFVQKPISERHTARLRIFTPKIELAFAGHPTIGAAVALGLHLRQGAVRLETHVGVLTCVMEKLDRHVSNARFSLPKLPEEVGVAPAAEAIAGALGIATEDIGCGIFEPSCYSAGTSFYLVPVRNSGVLKRLAVQVGVWGEVFPDHNGSVYVYTATPEERDTQFAARMFAPGMGIPEDPATGSAAAALIGQLAAQAPDGHTQYILRQGAEMGRPSVIVLQLRKEAGRLMHGGIGGEAVVIGQGSLDFGD